MDKDINVQLRIRNNLILREILKSYASVAEFCRAHGLTQSAVGRYINFKQNAVTKQRRYSIRYKPVIDGYYWATTVTLIAKALKVDEFDLFPQHLWDKRQNTFELEIDSENMIEFNENKYIEDNTRIEFGKALASLEPREEEIIKERFGFDSEQKTYREISERFGVSFERIRQIEQRALRKLRHPTRKKMIEIEAL